jgi:hypothetical protein
VKQSTHEAAAFQMLQAVWLLEHREGLRVEEDEEKDVAAATRKARVED